MNLDKQNSRKHSDRNKAAIRKSLETAKAARSIVIDSGDNVLAGNGVAEQWEAMGGKVRVVETSGDELVAVKRVDVAPDSPQARQIATLDNLVADTSAFDYDAERLREALANDPVSKAIAEQDERLRKLLKVTKPESVDAGELVDKAAQLQEKWQVKRGDIWTAGKHRLMCGDSTNAEDVARLMRGEKAQLVFTSPPYWVGKDYEAQTSLDEVKEFIRKSAIAMVLVANKDGGRIIVNCSTASARAINPKADVETLFTLAWWQDAMRSQNWLMRYCRVWLKNGDFRATSPSTDMIDQHWETINRPDIAK